MVILNIDFTINRLYTINSIKNLMEQIMEKYFEDEIIAKHIKGKKEIFNNIIKEKMEIVKSNHFWYLNSSNNNCTHIFKKGKKEGYMCQKKIRTNLNGQKQDYLCCKHSKKHIPTKKSNKKNNKYINSEFNKEKFVNNNNRKIKKKIKRKRNNKIFICNGGLMNFNEIFKKILT